MMRFLPIINRYHPLVVKMQTVIRYIKLLNSPHCFSVEEPKIKNGARSSSVLQHVFALDTMEGGSIKSIILCFEQGLVKVFSPDERAWLSIHKLVINDGEIMTSSSQNQSLFSS